MSSSLFLLEEMFKTFVLNVNYMNPPNSDELYLAQICIRAENRIIQVMHESTQLLKSKLNDSFIYLKDMQACLRCIKYKMCQSKIRKILMSIIVSFYILHIRSLLLPVGYLCKAAFLAFRVCIQFCHWNLNSPQRR